jgi:hypothetical protein
MENWNAGKLEDWKTGKLEKWNTEILEEWIFLRRYGVMALYHSSKTIAKASFSMSEIIINIY